MNSKRYLKIVWLYHDLLNLYGDRGNIIALQTRAKQRQVDVHLETKSIDDNLPKDTDIIFMGGGQDQEQVLVARDLKHKKSYLDNFIKSGGALLAICGSYQLLGEYYQPLKGKKIAGIGLLPIYTVASKQRMIGDIVIKDKDNNTFIGFENHSGKTYLKNVQPLGRVIKGYGNNGEDKTEGVIYKGIIGTYLHGSLLPKNPFITDNLIKRGLAHHGDNESLNPLKEPYLDFAREQAIKRAQTRKIHSLGLRS